MSTSPARRRFVIGLALLAAFNLGFFARPSIDAMRKADAFEILESTSRISQPGIPGAPKVYVAFDPFCTYCHTLYAGISSRVEAGEVQVEWIPVAFMSEHSNAVAAELLSAANPASALSTWFGEEPGTSPVMPKGANPESAAVQVAQNTTLIQALVGRNAVPAVFYRDLEGAMHLIVGSPSDLDEWLKGLSS